MMLARVFNRTSKVEVLSFPDLSHTAFAELFHDPIVPDSLPYHEGSILALRDLTRLGGGNKPCVESSDRSEPARLV